MSIHPVVSREEWTKARRALLVQEKQLTRQRDALSRQRRELPWVKVEKRYAFESPGGTQSLGDLFDGRSQLIVQHFMFAPEWNEGCPSCSLMADHVDGALPHLAARDVSFVAISRAPIDKLEAFRRRMGWRFRWVSSYGSDFNYDYHVSFTPDEMAAGRVHYNFTEQPFPSKEGPGISAFYQDAVGDVFHTYSTYARGVDHLVNAYNYLDLAPKGRDEDHLGFTMEWVRHHDRYAGGGGFADADKPYWPSVAGATTLAATPAGASCGCGKR